MGITCSTAIELDLTVGKKICSKGIYVFGKGHCSELQGMLCFRSWSFICVYRELNQAFPYGSVCSGNDVPAYCVYLTLSGFLLRLIVSTSS